MPDLYIFKTSENPDFLVGPLESWCFEEDRDRFKEIGAQFMDRLLEHFPEAGYPYLALMYDVILETDTLCFIRPDSMLLGGLRGGLHYWSQEYDASTPEGLAMKIDEQLVLPESPFQPMNPITHIVDFIGNHPVLEDSYKILNEQYGYDIKFVEL